MSRKTCRLDKPYRQWIHTLPCLVCGARKGIESHHAGDDKGMALKPPDSTCIPLCPEHHTKGRDAWHRGYSRIAPLEKDRERFERTHGVDVLATIARLNREYEAMGAKLEQRKPKRRPAAKAPSGGKQSMSERLRELREGKASRKA